MILCLPRFLFRDFGFEVTRKRNYFRNFDDIEEIGIPTRVFESEFGPLIDQAGKCTPFASFLRTREALPYGIIRASWTLYQPHEIDEALAPLFNFWTRTSIEDAEALPEHLVRNYCGNSFHPDLILSALGNNTVLRDWVSGNGEGPSTLVAEQSEAFQVFSSLCDKVSRKESAAIILQIEETSENLKVARFIIDLTTFIHRTIREVVHAQCALHCVTGIEGACYDQHGVAINPTRSVAAGMAI